MDNSLISISHCTVLAPKSIKCFYQHLAIDRKKVNFLSWNSIKTLWMHVPTSWNKCTATFKVFRLEMSQFDPIFVHLSNLITHWWDKPRVNHVAPNNSRSTTFLCTCMKAPRKSHILQQKLMDYSSYAQYVWTSLYISFLFVFTSPILLFINPLLSGLWIAAPPNA